MHARLPNKTINFSPPPPIVVKFPPPPLPPTTRSPFSLFGTVMHKFGRQHAFYLTISNIRQKENSLHLPGFSNSLKQFPPLFLLWGGLTQSFGTIGIFPNIVLWCSQLGKEHNFPPQPQLDQPHNIPQEDTLILNFSYPSRNFQGHTHQSSRCLNWRHPQFFSFTPAHLLEIWYHCVVVHESCSWRGLNHHQNCCNHYDYNEYPHNDLTKLKHWPRRQFMSFYNTVSSYIDVLCFWDPL